MPTGTGNRKASYIKNFLISILVIGFFVAIILTYYNMLVSEKRSGIIRDGEMSARQVETQFNEYLATSVDAIEMTAYTLEGMVADDKSGEEILEYLLGQSVAVINTIFENTMGVYGYINGGYYDGAGWTPDADFKPKERPWYIEAAANHGAVTLIDPYVDMQSGQVMMSLAKMLSDGESVVSMDIYLDRLQEITEDAVASDAADIELILDTRNMVVAHSDKSEVGKDYDEERGTLAAAVMEHLSESDDKFFEFYYNDSHYIAYQAMLQNNWRCLSIKDASSVFKPLERLLGGTVAIVAAVILVLSAFMGILSKSSHTIENLTEETMLDKLTGFLNKAGTAARMPELCREETGMLTVLDLDSFKLVNDLYGHDMGDRVLAAFADILRQNTRTEDVLCRIGGDEFLLFYRGVTDDKVVAGLTKRLNGQLEAECKRLMGDGFSIPIGVSVGAVSLPEHGRDYEQLFPLADKALYQVKQNGKHGFAVYDDSLRADCGDAESLGSELARITRILEERGAPDASLWLGRDDFTAVYRFLLRSLKHEGGCVVKLLLLLSAKESGREGETLEAAERFGAILNGVLSVNDAVLQSKPTQFLVLLPGWQSAESIVERILERWEESPYHAHFTVTYVSQELRFSGACAPNDAADA